VKDMADWSNNGVGGAADVVDMSRCARWFCCVTDCVVLFVQGLVGFIQMFDA
jgi:hypothetical protein